MAEEGDTPTSDNATHLALADTRMVLFGAVPAAALAVLVDGVLAVVEKRFRPAHLRGRRRRLK